MLLRSGVLQDSSPGMSLGAVGSVNRGAFNTFQVGDMQKDVSIPSGYAPGLALYPAITAQQMAARVGLAIGQSLSLVGGRALVADPVAISFGITGDGDAIAGAVGAVTFTFTAAGALTSPGPLAASVTFTVTPAATIGAEAGIFGDATFGISGTLDLDAWGLMTGTTEESGLTPAGIANTVWAKVIEAGFSAEQILRLLAAHAAGSATGLEGSNPQFTGLDGNTVRIDGSYSAGERTIDALNGD